MKLTAQIRLLPTDQQVVALHQTLERANALCDELSRIAFERKVFKPIDLHHLAYHDLRASHGLSSQLTVRCIRKVADAYNTLKTQVRKHNSTRLPDDHRGGTPPALTQIVFRPTGSVAFDDRILSYKLAKAQVSIWTVDGRQTIPFVVSAHHARLLASRQGESDLALVKGKWYLLATCDVPDGEPGEVVDALGVDLGIVNLATDSDGHVHSGAAVEAQRVRHQKRRDKLQAVGTKSAKRRLKKNARKQARFQKNTNHCISKSLVAKAKAANQAIVLEDLSGISKLVRKDAKRLRHTQRAKHSNWGFFQLRSYIAYKAVLQGVPVVMISPRNTSRTCHKCQHCEKANRKSQAEFVCVSCGHQDRADVNAAKNIKNIGLSSSNLWFQSAA